MDGRRIDKLLIVLPPSDAEARTTAVLASGAVLPPPLADERAPDEGLRTEN